MQPDMRTRLFLLTAMLGNFFALTSAYAEETADSYQQHFKKYLEYIQAVGTQDVCVERVEGRLQDKIEQTKRYNDWFRAQGPNGEKYLEDEPGEIEKEAVADVISICRMSPDDLHDLARNYRHGREGLDQDFDVAVSLYHYIYDVYDDIGAIHCLEDMGYIGDNPPTDEEREAVDKMVEEILRSDKKHQIERRKMDDLLRKHIPSFPFPPE